MTVEPEIEAVTSDSANYDHAFWGILNKQGQFWSPMPFHSEQDAKERLARYAKGANADMLTTHKIVPVRIQLSTLLAQSTGHDKEGSVE